jgi:hypothetical protein
VVSPRRYGSDITVTLPANGKFSRQQRAIYEVGHPPFLCCSSPQLCDQHASHVAASCSDVDQWLRLQGVLNTMETVRKRLKPGVAWPDMHRLADRCNLETLAAEVGHHDRGWTLTAAVLVGNCIT